MPVQYFYFVSRIPDPNNPINDRPLSPTSPLVIPQAQAIAPLTDAANPIYNVSQKFINNMQSVKSTDLTSAIPVIGLSAFDQDGVNRTNFTERYFSKTVNLSSVSDTSQRFNERPDMSLQHVTVSSTLGSGTGLLVFNEIEVVIKLHRPSAIANEELINLMKPGLPLRLKYGWSCITNDFLNNQAVELFKIREYMINFDEHGEGTLTIKGNTHLENLGNIFIGDHAIPIVDANASQAAQKAAQGTSDAGSPQLDGLAGHRQKVLSFFSYADANAVRSHPDSVKRMQETFKSLSLNYSALVERATDDIKTNLKQLMTSLSRVVQTNPSLFPDVVKKKTDGTQVQGEYVTLHHVISILCGSTLNHLMGTLIPANRDYRVVYGTYNDKSL